MERKDNPLLRVEHLDVYFRMYDKGFRHRDSHVIKDLSIEVAAGEVVAVVGASGSGKSVLAHTVLGLLPKNAWTRGVVIFDDNELTQQDKVNLRGEEIGLRVADAEEQSGLDTALHAETAYELDSVRA